MSSFYEISLFWDLCHIDTHYNSGSMFCPVNFSSLWGKELLSIQVLFHWAFNHIKKKNALIKNYSLLYSPVCCELSDLSRIYHAMNFVELTETQLCLLKKYSTFIASCNRQVYFFSFQSTESLPFPMSAVVILVWPMPCPDWLGSRWQDFNLVKSHYA